MTEDALLANDGRYRRPAITPDAIAVLQYTGGTTGTPKGAMLSHANLTVNVGQVTALAKSPTTGTRPRSRRLAALPRLRHDHGHELRDCARHGVDPRAEFELGTTLKLIGKLRPTIMPGVPTLYNALLHHPKVAKFDLSSLEYCISGGAALPVEVKRGFEAIAVAASLKVTA